MQPEDTRTDLRPYHPLGSALAANGCIRGKTLSWEPEQNSLLGYHKRNGPGRLFFC